MNIFLRKNINQDFFKIWSPEMSYVLGYIVADGCICKRKNRKNGYHLNITSKDREHLFRIRKELDSNHSIGLKYNSQRMISFQLQVSNQEICKDLMGLGILPRKTSNLKPIKVPAEYFPDFIRGFFDGDGTVYVYNVNRVPQIKVGFVSTSLSFFTDFNQRLCEYLGIDKKSIHRTTDKWGKRMIRYDIHFYINDCKKLAEFMYRDNPSLYLLRKYRIFEKWKLIKRRHYIKQNYPSKIGWRLNQKILVK